MKTNCETHGNSGTTPVVFAEKRCYSIEELMQMMEVSRGTVMQLLKKNEFRWFKVGAIYRISKSSFDNWMNPKL